MTTPLLISCIPVPTGLPDIPRVNIPNFGEMKKAWEAIDRIPDPEELLLKYMDQLSVAMAPIRRFLEIVQTFSAVVECFTAIPKAIMSLSPTPVFNCLKNLFKQVAKLLSYIPPFAYIQLILDICNVMIMLVDMIFDFFLRLDQKLTAWTNVYIDAEALGDTDLIQITECAAGAATNSLQLTLDVLSVIKAISDPIMEAIAIFIPAMQAGMKDYQAASSYFSSASDALQTGAALPGEAAQMVQHALIPIPPLTPVFTAAALGRNAMATLYNLLAPIIGVSPDAEFRSAPSYSNF